MPTQSNRLRIYDGQGDDLMSSQAQTERLILVPDKTPSREPDTTPRVRLMWGQHLLDDLLAGRYRSIVCAVNAEDNSHGIASQLAQQLPTSQWSPQSLTDHAKRFVARDHVTVIKYDMDAVEMLALLRPAHRSHLTLEDLSLGFKIVSEMVRRKTSRLPVASVSFLGARANRLVGEGGHEPSFETVLRTMYEAGFTGDVYPAPWMWESNTPPIYARYPFPESLTAMREGGF